MVHYIGERVILADGQQINRTAVGAGNYTVLLSDYMISKTAITSGGDTVTLPAASVVGEGTTFLIKDESGAAGTNKLLVDGYGSETIDGLLTTEIDQNYGSLALYTDGISWFVRNELSNPLTANSVLSNQVFS